MYLFDQNRQSGRDAIECIIKNIEIFSPQRIDKRLKIHTLMHTHTHPNHFHLFHRYYMEHKIFQHLLELKSLQIRSSKVNESLLVKRAVDDYHKSTVELGSETGSTLRRYPYKEYTFKNFEIFLYEVLKSLQKSGSNNFQNLSDVYLEVG